MPDTKLPPPSGDSQRAQGYVNQLIPLISESKLRVTHTDLSKHDPSSLHDHYSLDLQDYQIEISHSKQPSTGRDSYVILFNNLKNLSEDSTQKEILAYLVLTEEQFKKLKDLADEQIETLKKVEEEKRFKEAMTPVDVLISKIAKGQVDVSKSPQPVPDLPKIDKENKQIARDNPPTPPQEVTPPEVFHPETVAVKPRGESPVAENEDVTPTKTFSAPTEPVSALAAAAAIPVIEETAEPIQPTPQVRAPNPQPEAAVPTWPPPKSEPVEPEIPNQEVETPAPTSEPPTQALPNMPAPLPTPTLSIEEVQQALKKAYEQSPKQTPPSEYRPDLAHISREANLASAPLNTTIYTIPPENTPPANPQIDEAIDQAFKPANNLVLTSDSETPDV